MRSSSKTINNNFIVSQFDEDLYALWQQWPSPSTEISFWHSRLQLYFGWLVSQFDEGI